MPFFKNKKEIGWAPFPPNNNMVMKESFIKKGRGMMRDRIYYDENEHSSKSGDHENDAKSSKPYFPSMKPKKNAVVPSVPNKPNKLNKPQTIPKAFVKVPVVLGETTVQLNLDGGIEFPEPVLEIKEIKKNLKLTQYRLLLPTNKLFIKGFVRKNIQYATPKHSTSRYIVSQIHALTTDIPFETVTEIEFINEPVFQSNPDTKDFSFLTKRKHPLGFSRKEKFLSDDFQQYDQISGEVFNENPYCELLSSKFIEYDEALDRKMGRVVGLFGERMETPFEEGTFTKMEEKMIVEFTIKILQNQQVYVDYNDPLYS
ncbi:CsxC family protein [Metabacillus fastidiosus]